jgi:hypothetical protein
VVVASFTLARYPARRVPGVLAARRRMAGTPGLRFVRHLGTGRGVAMGLGGDLRRWATFAVWDDDEALDASLPVEAPGATEAWTARLAPLGSRGSWSGRTPIPADRATTDGPVAVLTRARLRVRSWPAFYRAVPPVEAALHAAPGVLAVVGVGEAPVGLQATFSLWRSTADMEAFAAAAGPHRDVARRARAEGWFAEELFARFRPYASSGTWAGRDPLAGAAGNGSVDTAAARRRSAAGTTGNSIP